MSGVLGVRFIEAGPVTYCSSGDHDLGIGDYVVVRTDRGERLGWVVVAPDQVLSATVEGPLRVVDRIASEADVDAWRERRRQAQEDIGRAQALATRSDPRLRVASISYDLAGRFAELTYTAGDRVEHDWFARQFGELLEIDELALEQVGDRDRAKALGGIGQCGRGLCCATWMTNFPQISIKMAKDQDLSPNPSKISGVCGRLLCCLSFEVEAYRELRGDLPRVGRRVTTPVGRAKVLSVNTLKQLVRLRFDETGEVVEMGADELRAQYGTAVRPEELESVVEEPRRQKERRIRDTTIAIMEPVTERSATADAPADVAEGGDRRSAEDEAESDGAGPRRRRRGRRGGRRRRRPGDEGAPATE
ncbi:MAG: regulatory iron-sulfur-containing complex subunit RicT [Chloroflexi bacterium]|nr:regulatory iron-sulfur-containing complex subunit RicT [Chloroflexota bacterium]